jgi:hypothetical protein
MQAISLLGPTALNVDAERRLDYFAEGDPFVGRACLCLPKKFI